MKKLAKDKILEYRKEHPEATNNEICEALDLGYETVRKITKDLGISVDGRSSRMGFRQQEIADYIKDFPEASNYEISEALDIEYKYVCFVIERDGLRLSKKDLRYNLIRDYFDKNPNATRGQAALDLNINERVLNRDIQSMGLTVKVKKSRWE